VTFPLGERIAPLRSTKDGRVVRGVVDGLVFRGRRPRPAGERVGDPVLLRIREKILSRLVRLGSVLPVLGRFAVEPVLAGVRGRVLRRSRLELEAGRRITPFEDRDLARGAAELRPIEL